MIKNRTGGVEYDAHSDELRQLEKKAEKLRVDVADKVGEGAEQRIARLRQLSEEEFWGVAEGL